MSLVLRQGAQSYQALAPWVSQRWFRPLRLFLLKTKWDQHFHNNLCTTSPAPLWRPFGL